MTTLLDLAKKRRSIRKYSPKTIEHNLLELIAETARYAPTACNAQPWKFIIIDDPALRSRVAETFSDAYGMNTFAGKASAFIFIVSERKKLIPQIGGLLQNTDFTLIDTGIACAHIALAATELNIGTCILGWFNEKKLKRMLSVPPSKRIELVVALGFPEDENLPPRRLKEISEVIGHNKY